MDTDLKDLTDDALMAEMTSWAGRVASGEARLLVLLGEFDAREAFVAQGLATTAQWAAWKLGLTRGAAREKVRIARALRHLPGLTEQMLQGRLSYSQARAITRVATAGDEQIWIDLARVTTGSQLERTVQAVRRVRAGDDPKQRLRQDLTHRYDDNGDLLLTMRVAAANAPAVMARIEQAQQAEQSDRDALYAKLNDELLTAAARAGDVSAETPAGVDVSAETPADLDVSAETPNPTDGADPEAPPYAAPYRYEAVPFPQFPDRGLFAPRTPEEKAVIAEYWAEDARRLERHNAACAWEEYVEAKAAAKQHPERRATLGDGFVRALTRPDSLKPTTVQVLIDPLSGWARTSRNDLLSPTTLKHVLKTLPGRGAQQVAVRPMTADDLTVADLGRRSRLVSPALRRLLGQLDGERCRFPGCDHVRDLHAHHVVYWRNGGKTDLANLVLVCQRHHTLIHSEGFQLVLSPDRTLTVRTRDDIPVPQHPAPPEGDAGALPVAGPFSSDWANDPFDLGFVVWATLQHTR